MRFNFHLPLKKCMFYNVSFNPYVAGGYFWPMQNDTKKTKKMTEILAYGYSSESTQ